jgi:hypothetical protein
MAEFAIEAQDDRAGAGVLPVNQRNPPILQHQDLAVELADRRQTALRRLFPGSRTAFRYGLFARCRHPALIAAGAARRQARRRPTGIISCG